MWPPTALRQERLASGEHVHVVGQWCSLIMMKRAWDVRLDGSRIRGPAHHQADGFLMFFLVKSDWTSEGPC